MTSGPEVDQCTHCEDMLFHRGYVVDEHGKLAAVNVGPPAKVTSVLAVTVGKPKRFSFAAVVSCRD